MSSSAANTAAKEAPATTTTTPSFTPWAESELFASLSSIDMTRRVAQHGYDGLDLACEATRAKGGDAGAEASFYRSVLWRIFLRLLPFPYVATCVDNITAKWLDVMFEQRAWYATEKHKAQQQRHDEFACPSSPSSTGALHADPAAKPPALGSSPVLRPEDLKLRRKKKDGIGGDSSGKAEEERAQLLERERDIIWMDVIRSYSARDLLVSRDMLYDILDLWRRLHPQTGYHQGMHEIAGTCLRVLKRGCMHPYSASYYHSSGDAAATSSAAAQDDGQTTTMMSPGSKAARSMNASRARLLPPDAVRHCCCEQHLEADAYVLFCGLMFQFGLNDMFAIQAFSCSVGEPEYSGAAYDLHRSAGNRSFGANARADADADKNRRSSSSSRSASSASSSSSTASSSAARSASEEQGHPSSRRGSDCNVVDGGAAGGTPGDSAAGQRSGTPVSADDAYSLPLTMYEQHQPFLDQMCDYVQNTMIRHADPDLHGHMAANDVEAMLYLPRWLRNMFTRELSMGQLLAIWDGLFATHFLWTVDGEQTELKRLDEKAKAKKWWKRKKATSSKQQQQCSSTAGGESASGSKPQSLASTQPSIPFLATAVLCADETQRPQWTLSAKEKKNKKKGKGSKNTTSSSSRKEKEKKKDKKSKGNKKTNWNSVGAPLGVKCVAGVCAAMLAAMHDELLMTKGVFAMLKRLTRHPMLPPTHDACALLFTGLQLVDSLKANAGVMHMILQAKSKRACQQQQQQQQQKGRGASPPGGALALALPAGVDITQFSVEELIQRQISMSLILNGVVDVLERELRHLHGHAGDASGSVAVGDSGTFLLSPGAGSGHDFGRGRRSGAGAAALVTAHARILSTSNLSHSPSASGHFAPSGVYAAVEHLKSVRDTLGFRTKE